MSPERVHFLAGVYRETWWLSGREGGQPCPSPGTPGPSESFLRSERCGHSGGHQVTGDLEARTRCVWCRAWIWVPCVLYMELVLNGEGGSGLQRAVKTPGAPGDELAEHRWQKWWQQASTEWSFQAGTLLSALFMFHLNESLNRSWHRCWTIHWRRADWGSERSSLAQDHTARERWNWLGIGSKVSPVSHKILNPWAYVMEKTSRLTVRGSRARRLPCFCSGSLPSAQLWHLLGVSAHSAL